MTDKNAEEMVFGTFPGTVEEAREKVYNAVRSVSPAEAFDFVAMYNDHVVIGTEGNQFFKYTYELQEDGSVKLGEPLAVTPTFIESNKRGRGRPATPRYSVYSSSGSAYEGATEDVDDIREELRVLEQTDDKGWVWDIVIIESGISQNGIEYPAGTLMAAAPLYEKAQVYADHPTDAELRARKGNRTINDLAGWIENVRWQSGSLVGELHIVESDKWSWLRDLMVAAATENKALFGFSHNISYKADAVEQKVLNGRRILTLKEIHAVNSVDIVTRPAAGGSVLRMVAHVEEETKMFKNMEELRAAKPALYESLMLIARTNYASFSIVAKEWVEEIPDALEPEKDDAPVQKATEDVQDQDPRVKGLEASLAEMRKAQEEILRAQCQTILESKLTAESKIPAPARDKIRAKFAGKTFDVADLDSEIAYAKEIAAAYEQVNGSGRVTIPALSSRVGSPREEMVLALDGLFENKDQKDKDGESIPRFRTIKEAFMTWTETPFERADGMTVWLKLRDKKVTLGQSYDSHLHEHVIMEDLISTTWGEIWADRMHKKMMRDYVAMADDFPWRRVTSEVGSVSDFRTHRQQRLGGYGTLTTVEENELYPDLTTPGDEEVTYNVVKYGGLERVTMESIVNDDMNVVRRLPGRMARSAHETIYRNVMNLIRDGNTGTIYDSSALFATDASHGNYVTTALSHAALSTARSSMRSQTAYGDTTAFLGLTPRLLLVPNELEDTAWRLANSNAYGVVTVAAENTTTPNMHKGLEIMVVDYWTDATNWFLIADTGKIDTIGVYFLNGREEPELFVQDDPTVGDNMFYDRMTMKVRIIFDEVVLDYRGMYGAFVA